MKIIKKGTKSVSPEWIGYEKICFKCGCIFKLEDGDGPEFVEFVSDQRNGDFYWIKCPQCKQREAVSVKVLKSFNRMAALNFYPIGK